MVYLAFTDDFSFALILLRNIEVIEISFNEKTKHYQKLRIITGDF